MSDNDRPIPIPFSERLRTWRSGVAPPLVFLGLCGVIAWLWQGHVQPMSLTGEVEAVRARVVSPMDGTLVRLEARAQRRVEEGDELAWILPGQARLAAARLAVVGAEIERITATLDPLMTRRRVEFDHLALHLDLMSQRVNLAEEQARRPSLAAALQRARDLHARGGGSLAELEQAEAARDALEASISGREELIARLEADLNQLDPASWDEEAVDGEGGLDPVRAEIAVQEAQLRLIEEELAPLVLRAPMSGVANFSNVVVGEYVSSGEVIGHIEAESGARIVAYLSPPLSFQPEVGMPVEILTRETRPRRGRSEVVAVSAQYQPMPQPGNVMGMRQERGLPVFVSLPDGVDLRPGEPVNLRIEHRRALWNW